VGSCLVDISPVSTNRLNLIWTLHQQYTRPRPISWGAEVDVRLNNSLSLQAVPQLRRPLVGFPLRRTGFDHRSSHMGFLTDKVAGFLRVLGFPCHFSFHRMLRTHLPSADGTVGPLMTGVPSWLSPHLTNKNNLHFRGFYLCTWSGNKVPGLMLHDSH
jgi:hypothetical protein